VSSFTKRLVDIIRHLINIVMNYELQWYCHSNIISCFRSKLGRKTARYTNNRKCLQDM